MASSTCLLNQKKKALKVFEKLQIGIVLPRDIGYVATLQVALPLVDRINKRQGEDLELMKIKKGVEEGKMNDFHLKEGVLGLKGGYVCQILYNSRRK